MARRILVVEDDVDGQEVLATILEYAGLAYDVAGETDTAEQFLFGSGNEYGVLVIDLALPVTDGWQFLKSVRANPNTATVPCVAVTAYHTSKLREEALVAGFDAYFPKPIDSTSFLRELARMVS